MKMSGWVWMGRAVQLRWCNDQGHQIQIQSHCKDVICTGSAGSALTPAHNLPNSPLFVLTACLPSFPCTSTG